FKFRAGFSARIEFRLYRINRAQAVESLHAGEIRDCPRLLEWEIRSIRSARIPVAREQFLPSPPRLAALIHRAQFRLYPPVPCPLRTAVSPAPQSRERLD